jgi:glycosyltransferase involved in cell wall biosynthesis
VAVSRSTPHGGRLRIGFDGRSLTSPAAGVRRYATELLSSLVQLGEPLDVVLLGGDPSSVDALGLEHVREGWHPPTNAGWMLVGLPLAARRARVDVLHAPAYTAPFWSPAPTVLTIHDVSYERHPEWFPYRRDALRRAFYRRSALSAHTIITDSRFSADEIHAAYGIDRRRIVVVPLGVDAAFGWGTQAAAPLPSGVTAPFVLHVGDLHERRNVGMALDAVLEARRRGGAVANLSLVLAGVDRGTGQAVLARARDAGAPAAATLVGSVSDAELRALYRGALALVYPSLYEGFGLPLLEAMAMGAPVVASQAASIPEVAGGAALLLDPHDRAAWTDAILRIAQDSAHRDDLRARGLARAAQCTWEEAARRTLEVYRSALG